MSAIRFSLLAVLLVIAATSYAKVDNGIVCHECNSKNDPTCENNIRDLCARTYGMHRAKACGRTIRRDANGEVTYLSRHCEFYRASEQEQCKTVPIGKDGATEETCTCGTDRCN